MRACGGAFPTFSEFCVIVWFFVCLFSTRQSMVCDASSELFFELLLSSIFAQVVSSAIPYPGHASAAVVTSSPMPHWPGTGLFSADGSSALCAGDYVSDPDDIMTDGVSSSLACTVFFLEAVCCCFLKSWSRLCVCRRCCCTHGAAFTNKL